MSEKPQNGANGGEMQKTLGLVPALAIVIGIVIGSGVFFKPHAIFTATGSPGLGLVAWVIGGLITIAGGLTVAEIAAALPRTGGMVVYLEESFGSIWAYLLGWTQTVIYLPALIAALAVIFAKQAAVLMNLSEAVQAPIAIAAIIFLVIMNSLGSKTGGIIQTVATVGKLIPLIAIIIVGLMSGEGGTANLSPMTDAAHPVATGLGAALMGVMFAFDGWTNVGSIAGEMKNPGRDLPRAIIAGLLIVTAVYLLINVAYLFVLPASALAATETPAADVANIIFGATGGKVITAGILVSVFGAMNAYIMTGMRVPLAMAQENKIPFSSFFSKLHPKFQTPANCGIIIAVIASLMTLTGKFDLLTDLGMFVILIFYALTFAAVIVLRKKQPDLPRPYRVPLYPILPIIGIVGSVYMVINTIITQPMNAGVGLALALIGLPLYYARKSKFTKHE